MKNLPNIVGGVALVIGVVWMLQGANVLGGSFMSGQSHWLAIGALVALASAAYLVWQNTRRS